ncbi:phosphoglycerate kinase [bacterium]|nr:phosphoglycerate kinase [bacterium]
MGIPLIADQKNLKGKRVLVRLDLNVPIEKGKITDDFRIRKALPTLLYLQEQRAHVVAISHIGRNPEDSLKPVAGRLSELLNTKILFAKDIREAKEVGGDIILLENLRQNPGEETNNPSFAEELASLGEIFVNEAFSASHRAHASIVGVPKLLPSFAGIQFSAEVEHLSRALHPEHPFLFILGGAKFETKLPFLQKFTELADFVFVGGALGNDILRARGYEIGHSTKEDHLPEYLAEFAGNKKLLPILDVLSRAPGDVVTARRVDATKSHESIVDAGPETIRSLAKPIQEAKCILMNGPLGWYEKGFGEGTKEVLKMVAKNKSATSLIGGGDTIALIDQMGIEKEFTFVSTGGGAMLDYLVDGELPGITALEKNGK